MGGFFFVHRFLFDRAVSDFPSFRPEFAIQCSARESMEVQFERAPLGRIARREFDRRIAFRVKVIGGSELSPIPANSRTMGAKLLTVREVEGAKA
jgi:hypothetical protein